jgi:hypothetical protein
LRRKDAPPFAGLRRRHELFRIFRRLRFDAVARGLMEPMLKGRENKCRIRMILEKSPVRRTHGREATFQWTSLVQRLLKVADGLAHERARERRWGQRLLLL